MQSKYEYDPTFPIRGLHCDVEQGILMKIDSFHNIQMGTAYRGLEPVSDKELLKIYGGRHVGIEDISGFYGTGRKMYQLVDMFALPEMTLYANVIQFLNDYDIKYCTEHVFYDVRNNVQRMHVSGQIHQAIEENLEKYLIKREEIMDLFQRLSSAGKKLFLVTNSSAEFVDKGMTHLVGPDWFGLFDFVITSARKPKFFTDATRPFRKYDLKKGIKSWKAVDNLQKGCIYQEGNITHLMNATGWTGDRVLYIGDHVYTDLADANLKLGWRTGAIITELEDQIQTINSEQYKKAVTWNYALEALISSMQVHQDAESQQTIGEWKQERQQMRRVKKELFNVRFGSLFRSFHNPTYFARRLSRFADVYTSSLVNFLNYPVNYTFYPHRTALPHEIVPSEVDVLSCLG